MQKFKFLTVSLVLAVSLFAYQMPQDVVHMGTTIANSSSYKLWGSVGQSTAGISTGDSYVLNGGYISGYGIEEEESFSQGPKEFSLAQNYPNPFHSVTTMKFAIAKQSDISLRIYDVAGQLTRTLFDKSAKAGYYTAYWDGRDNNGQRVAPGVYFYRLETPDFRCARKMILLR